MGARITACVCRKNEPSLGAKTPRGSTLDKDREICYIAVALTDPTPLRRRP